MSVTSKNNSNSLFQRSHFIYGLTGLSDRKYSGGSEKIISEGKTYSYTTVLGARRVIPAYRIASDEEVATWKREREKQLAEEAARREEAAKAQELARQAELARRAAENQIVKTKFVMEKATSGDASYQFDLGKMYLDGNGVEKNVDLATQWLSKSAAQGNEDAFRLLKAFNPGALAKIEKPKDGISAKSPVTLQPQQSESQARIDNYKALAAKGSVPAMIRLGKCYRDGDGVERDLKKAKELFQKAAGTHLAGYEQAREEAAKLALTCEE